MFVFHVPDLVDELSGNKARRQIKRLKELNAGAGIQVLDKADTKDFYSLVQPNSMLTDLERPVLKPIIEESNKAQQWVEDNKSGSLSDWLSSSDSNDVDTEEEVKTGFMDKPPVEDDEEEVKTGYVDVDEEIPTGYINQNLEEELKTGFIDQNEVATGFIDEDSIKTAFIDESEVTGILNSVEDFMKNKRSVIVIEEQTSLVLGRELE